MGGMNVTVKIWWGKRFQLARHTGQGRAGLSWDLAWSWKTVLAGSQRSGGGPGHEEAAWGHGACLRNCPGSGREA